MNREHGDRKRPPILPGPLLSTCWWLGLRWLCWEGWQTPHTARRQPQPTARHLTTNSRPSSGETRSHKNDHVPEESRRQDQRYHQCLQSRQRQRIYEVKTDTDISPLSKVVRKQSIKQLKLPFCHLQALNLEKRNVCYCHMHLNVPRVPRLDAQGMQRYAGLTQPVPTCHAGLCSQEVCCVPVPCCSGAFWVLEMTW